MTSFIDDDGNELEYSGKDFAVTKQLVSFRDFRLKGNFSVSIKIDNSAHNRASLGYFGDNQVNPVVKKRFSVFRDGNKIDRGYVIVTSIDREEIEIFFASGNSNLFEAIDFNCNEITTSKYNTIANPAFANLTWSRTEGIIFPIVDWVFGGEKYGNVFYGSGLNVEVQNGVGEIADLVPCLYAHTLLKEIFVHAQVSITGDIFNDPFFKTIIITPNSIDDVRVGPPNSTVPGGKLSSNIVKPENIAPAIKVVEFLKWVSLSFGCLIDFDVEANEVSINMLDNRNHADAQDWSDYYIESQTQTDKYFNKNYIRYRQSEELNISKYNKDLDVLYGDALIESDKNDGSVKDPIYKSPFISSYDVIGESKLRFATPVCEMFRMKDKVGYSFSSVSAATDLVTSGGVSGFAAQFNGTGFPFNGLNTNQVIFRVDSGIYKGFHVSLNNISGSSSSSTSIWSDMPYIGNSSGTLYLQEMEKIGGHRVLSCIPGISPDVFIQYPTIGAIGDPDGTPISTVATAYFSKKLSIYSTLNSYSQGLHYDTIQESDRKDKSLKDCYLGTLTRILQQPPVKAKFLLPQDVFLSYTSDYIFIRSLDLNGRFLVEKIENYIDSVTPVTAYLLKV